MVLLTNEGVLKISFENSIEYEKPSRIYPFANSEVFESKIINCVKLTQGEDVKDVYGVDLDLTNIDYNFQPGDTIGVLPQNNIEEINEILKILNCEDISDDLCYFYVENEKKRKNFAHLPLKSTLKRVFLENVDVRTPMKKVFLKTLSNYCNFDDKKFLCDLSLPKNSNDYFEFISKSGRTLLGFLKKISSCKPPIDLILENLPPLQPRPYSIASSPLIKDKLHLIFSIINVVDDLKGVCSSYLEKTCLDKEKIKFYFRKSTFIIENNSLPIIMIGPGTGLAPFLGFLQNLYLKNQKLDTWLFFGCRYKERDFLNQSDLEKYLEHGCLNKLSVAFSREQSDKVYVTHLILKESDLFYKKFVKENGSVYICGDAKNMFKDVRETVLRCLVENKMNLSEAEAFLNKKVKEMKYVEDKWV